MQRAPFDLNIISKKIMKVWQSLCVCIFVCSAGERTETQQVLGGHKVHE